VRETFEALVGALKPPDSRVQCRNRRSRSYSATKPRNTPSVSSTDSISANVDPDLRVGGDVLEPAPSDGAGQAHCAAIV
jgi:hypothetical protein